MSRNRVVGSAIVVLAIAVLSCANLGGPQTLPVGEAGPGFGIRVRNQTVTLDDLKGTVVLVNFWSST